VTARSSNQSKPETNMKHYWKLEQPKLEICFDDESKAVTCGDYKNLSPGQTDLGAGLVAHKFSFHTQEEFELKGTFFETSTGVEPSIWREIPAKISSQRRE
jgi:hypothetical protein